MKNMKKKVNVLALSVSATFVLSACSSLPFMGDTAPKSNANRERPQTQNNVALQSEIEDFKSMKPSLSRLVALESDLSFLLEEMSRFNEQNPVMFEPTADTNPQNVSQENNTVIFNAEGAQEIASEQLVDGWAKGQGSMADKWNSQSGEMDTLGMTQRQRPSQRAAAPDPASKGVDTSKFDTNSNVDVTAAAPVRAFNAPTQTASAPGPSVSSARPSQFRQGNQPLIANNLPTPPAPRSQGQVDMAKFSTNPRQIVGDVSSCNEWKADSTKTYSLHLASYTSRNAAESGWNKLDEKYADVWCDTQATLATVMVKGTEYLSLRVGAYDSRDKVLSLCSVIKERGDYCAVSTATGERIQ